MDNVQNCDSQRTSAKTERGNLQGTTKEKRHNLTWREKENKGEEGRKQIFM
jgi:hypothetical protein